jgi:hypothetical protein
MKSKRFFMVLAFFALSAMSPAQSDPQKYDSPQSDHPQMSHPHNNDPSTSEAQKTFHQIKDLAGVWRGPVTIDPPMKQIKGGEQTQVSMRVTSRGNALVHEMKDPSMPDDPARYDHPLTMFYLDNDRLLLTHYCDAGNRPRMVARTSPDGKVVEFDFLDIAGSTQFGNMYHAVFTSIDANHHIEDWTYMMPGNKPVHAHIDLTRAQ